MLTQTSETAIRALIYLGYQGDQKPLSPRVIAQAIGESPTYMAKIARMLAKANLVRSHRGAAGGISLSREPGQIQLLEIVEACQGLLVGNYCQSIATHPDPVCSFHQAMLEVHMATLAVLRRWTLGMLMERPGPSQQDPALSVSCRMNLNCLLEDFCAGKTGV